VRLAFALVFACSSRAPAPAHEPTIVGTWDEVCRVSGREVTACTGKDDSFGSMEFAADGRWSARSRGEGTTGTWKLDGERLEVSFVIAGKPGTDEFRPHLDGDRLALWNPAVHVTTVYTRRGARPELVATKESKGDPVTATLSGVTYTLALPAGYRLASDESYRQLWSRADGDGVMVEIKVSEHTGEPCSTEPARTGETNTIDGVQRDTKVGANRCMHGSDVACMVKHPRGYLEPSEVAAGWELCRAITVH
jgi:hypothetical protein